MKKNIEILKGYVEKIGKKRLLSLLVTCLLIMVFLGGTFALWDWKSTDAQKTEVVFTAGRPFRCSADVGGDVTSQGVPMAPTTCNDSSRAIKKKLTTTTRTIETLKDEDISIFMDLRLDINSIDSELSESKNLKYALTTSDNSCTDGVISSGTFNGLEANDKVDLLVNKEYSGNEERVYYLYIWLDAAETNINTAGKNFNFSINGECTNLEPEHTVTFDANGGIMEGEGTLITTVGQTQYVVSKTGEYKLEVWGAQGATYEARGGYGGYSVGTVNLEAGTILYANVGGKGSGGNEYEAKFYSGGYNGGGTGIGSGGGATHIATASGELKNLSSNKNAVLIVAGGGGGAYYGGPKTTGQGGDGGGYQGGAGDIWVYGSCAGSGGSQTVGGSGCGYGVGSFGQGGSSSDRWGSAGGGGWYGGGASPGLNDLDEGYSPGGGGSGYIGSSLLTDKEMYCYECSQSTAEHTLTKLALGVSEDPIANYAKKGNGAVRISSFSVWKNEYEVGSIYGTLPSATKEGLIFGGWNTKPDGTGETITSDSIVDSNDNQTLYATWYPYIVPLAYDYKVNMSFDTGEYADTGYIVDWGKNFSIEVDFNVPTGSNRHIIIGNYNGSDTKVLSFEVNASNQLRFYIGTGSVDKTLGAVTIGETVKLIFTWDVATKKYTITAKGAVTDISASGSLSLTGKSVNSLRIGTKDYRTTEVTFYPMTISGLKISATEDKNVMTELPTLNVFGYAFVGWNTKSDGTGTTITNDKIIYINENQTLYAIWREGYLVNYDANGGSGAPAIQTKDPESTLFISDEIPLRVGYAFLGWSADSTATSATYRPGDSYTANEPITLYAVWQEVSIISGKIRYTFYSGNGGFADDGAYVDINYQVSYDPINNQSTIMYDTVSLRLGAGEAGNRNFKTTLNVKANDSSDIQTSIISFSSYKNSGGYYLFYNEPKPQIVAVKHSDTVGEKSVTIDSSTLYKADWTYTGDWEKEIVVGSYAG